MKKFIFVLQFEVIIQMKRTFNQNLNQKKHKKKYKKKPNNEESYELLENFTPFQHEYSLHEASVKLSSKDLELDIQPYFIFLKFFSNQIMKDIVGNTNIYAYAHGVKVGKSNSAGHQ